MMGCQLHAPLASDMKEKTPGTRWTGDLVGFRAIVATMEDESCP
jgi:hypothetical protein